MLKCQRHVCSDYCLKKRKRVRKEEDPESTKRRVCKVGCGVEENPFKCDTPGFRLRGTHDVVTDIRGYTRLELKRNDDRRLLQSSSYALQSWRANCDVQLMLYQSDPDNPDLSELAAVTDYVVSYACKGNESVTEEKQKMKSYILSLDHENIDLSTVTLARKIMNNASKDKLISMQEATVLLANMDLCFCSENIQYINLSGSYRLDTGQYASQFYNLYANRIGNLHMSMDEYFQFCKCNDKRLTIPHYVGGKMQPVWPPTEEFARSMLVVHRPWHKKFDISSERLIPEFEDMYRAGSCPQKLKLTIDRELFRHKTQAFYTEPVSKATALNYADFTQEDYDESNEQLVALVSTLPSDAAGAEDDHNFDYGRDYEWHCPAIPLPACYSQSIDSWIDENVCKSVTSTETCPDSIQNLRLPTKHDGTPFTLDGATSDQADILAYILKFIHTCFNSCTTTPTQQVSLKPIRMTITGVAGSGKSTFIHTLTTALRNIFQSTDAVKVCAPTGNAASNVFGSTCHYTCHVGMLKATAEGIPVNTLKALKQEFAQVVCMIVDERSLLSSKLLARMEYNCRHAVNNGLNQDYSWGNIPVVLLIGDDYQLPPIDSGAFNINSRFATTSRSFDLVYGEKIFLELASKSMALQTSKRVLPDQEIFRDLLLRLRAESDTVSNFHVLW